MHAVTAPKPPRTPAVNRSVARVFAVTEALVRARSRISATELAAATGYPYTTIVADLKSLQGLGYVSFDPDAKTYAPTLKITLLAGTLSTRARLADELRRTVDSLARTTRETSIVWQRVGGDMQMLHVALGQESLRMVVEPGMTYPIEGSASGRAWSIAPSVAQAAGGTLAARGRVNGRASTEAVELQKAARRGYATAYETHVPHVGSIAMPFEVPSEGDGEPLVVSVGGVAARIREREAEIAGMLARALEDLRRRCRRIVETETNGGR
jgi:DNA-binding IclR family transcriptional regulator